MDALAGLAIGAIGMFGLIWEIFTLIASIKVVKKMGEPWWAAIVPFYHDYVLYKHVWIGWIGIVAAVLQCFGNSVQSMQESGSMMGMGGLSGICGLVYFVLHIIFCIKLSKAFGHGTGYALGLIFLEPIFILMLGFSEDRYLGNPSEV